MAILPIYLHPHPVLRQKAQPVAEVTAEIRQLMDDMMETARTARGVGLAANQVGRLERVIVLYAHAGGEVGAREIDEKSLIALANPEVIAASDDLRMEQEGCLSIPQIFTEFERPADVTVRALNYDGEVVELTFSGLPAACVQHEIDHLDGILFPDHVSKLRQKMLWKKYDRSLPDWLEEPLYPYVKG